MRRIWKVWRIFCVMLTWTAALRLYLRRFPEKSRADVCAARQMAGCGLLCRILGIEVNLMGRRSRNGGRLVVSNHFGVLDPLILASVLPVSFVAKSEMRKWPLIGWVAESFGVLFVDRKRRTSVPKFTEDVQERMAADVDVLVFPEGTTSPDLSILPFKTGVFESIAGRRDQSVLPVYLSVEEINGEPVSITNRSRVVWSDPNLPFLKHCWEVAGLRHVKMEVRVGEPIDVQGHDRKELAQLSRAAVEELRGPLPEDRRPEGRLV